MQWNEKYTYSRVIESETKERQLEVEILMQLWHRCVNIGLMVTIIVGTATIEEWVEKVPADVLQSLRGNGVSSWSIMEGGRLRRCHAAVGICDMG